MIGELRLEACSESSVICGSVLGPRREKSRVKPYLWMMETYPPDPDPTNAYFKV